MTKKRNAEKQMPLRKNAPSGKRSERTKPEPPAELPIPYWEEDFSAVKIRLNALRASGVTDWRAYLESHPEEVDSCLSALRVRAVSAAALELFRYDRKETFLKSPPLPRELEWRNVMREEVIALAEGGRAHESDWR